MNTKSTTSRIPVTSTYERVNDCKWVDEFRGPCIEIAHGLDVLIQLIEAFSGDMRKTVCHEIVRSPFDLEIKIQETRWSLE